MADGDTLRVIPAGPGFEHLLALMFDQILEGAHGNTLVLLNGRRMVQHPTSQGTSDTGTVPGRERDYILGKVAKVFPELATTQAVIPDKRA